MPETTRTFDSRMSAMARAMASPITKETTASGIVPVIPPSTIGPRELQNRSALDGMLLGDVLAEVLLGDRRECAVLAERRERAVHRVEEFGAALAEGEGVAR